MYIIEGVTYYYKTKKEFDKLDNLELPVDNEIDNLFKKLHKQIDLDYFISVKDNCE